MREVAEKTIKNAKKVWAEWDEKEKAGTVTKKQAEINKARAHKAAESARASQGYSGGNDGSKREPVKKGTSYTYVDGKNKRIVSNTGDFDDKDTGEYDVEKRDKRTNKKRSYDYRGKDDKGGIEEVYKSALKEYNDRKPPVDNVNSETDLLKGYEAKVEDNTKLSDEVNSETDLLKNYTYAGDVKSNEETTEEGGDYLEGNKTGEIDNDFKARADEAYGKKATGGMNDYAKNVIKEAGMRWEEADQQFKAGEISEEEANQIKQEAHQEAESIRNKYGFSGGDDGTKTNMIDISGEGVFNGTAEMNPETGMMEFEGENSDVVNALLRELESAKSDQEFYEKAMQGLMNKTETFNENDILTYEEALKQAENQINPLYDNARDEYMEEMDKDAVRRGVFNQIPQEAMKRYKVGELENQRSSNIAGLANDLKSKSLQEAQGIAQQKQQEMQSKLSLLMAGLQASGNKSQMAMSTINTVANIQAQQQQLGMQKEQLGMQKEQNQWEREYNENNQNFNQQMALTELGMQKEKMQMDEVFNSQKISQTWANIANDRTQLAQASERLDLSRRGQELSENEFKIGLADKAWEMTETQLLQNDDSTQFDEDIYEALAESDKQYNDKNNLYGHEGEESEMMNQAGAYLEEIKNESDFTVDEGKFKDLYRENLDRLNVQMGGFDEYKD